MVWYGILCYLMFYIIYHTTYKASRASTAGPRAWAPGGPLLFLLAHYYHCTIITVITTSITIISTIIITIIIIITISITISISISIISIIIRSLDMSSWGPDTPVFNPRVGDHTECSQCENKNKQRT